MSVFIPFVVVIKGYEDIMLFGKTGGWIECG